VTVAAVRAHPIARYISDWFEPRTWITVVTIGVGWHAGGLAGAGWGLLAVVAAAVLPTLLIKHGVRLGRYTDSHLSNRRQRLPVMAFVVTCVAVSLGLLSLAGAPRAVIVLNLTMLAAISVLTAITTVWKISIHCAVSCGGVTVLVITFGPALAVGYLLVALTSWSRVVLREHTAAQAIAGIIAGAASALIFLALR
jgi:hypothetical protein